VELPFATRRKADGLLSELYDSSAGRLDDVPARPSSPDYLQPSQLTSATGRTSSPTKSSAIPDKGICHALPADPDNRTCAVGKQGVAEQNTLRAKFHKPAPPKFISSFALAAASASEWASASRQQDNGNLSNSAERNILLLYDISAPRGSADMQMSM
jgi:hypothetical protein